MDYLIIFLSILFSAFFSGMETAFLTSNKLKLELAIKSKGIRARILSIFSNNPSKYISTLLVGNNVIIVIYGIYMSKLLEPYLSIYIHNDFYLMFVKTIISTFIILIFGEFAPKALFRVINNASLKFFAIPLIIFYYLFYPIVGFIIWLVNIALKIFTNKQVESDIETKVFGRVDIEDIIQKSKFMSIQRVQVSQELKIFQNALDFSSIKLRECIIPRNKIIAVPISTSIELLRDKFIESGHSNILIYRESVDEIDGYVNFKDILKNPQNIQGILRQVLLVPETMSAKKLFEQLIQQGKSLAVVVDEFGSTAGLASVEDILEEIFGEFEDEHDNNEVGVVQTNEGNYIINGRQEVDVFNEDYGFSLKLSDDYETIAGYILFYLGNFPKEGSIIYVNDGDNNFKFKIVKITDTKIEKVMLYGS